MNKNKLKRGLILAASLAMCAVLLGSFGKSLAEAKTARDPDANRSIYRIPTTVANVAALSTLLASMNRASVERIVDGDTIVVVFASGAGFAKAEKIRLIGVDTPETVDPRRPVERFGMEASKYVGRKLQGKTVCLAFEQKLRDNYGRLLAYVFLEDGSCVNLDIVAQGYGFAYTRYPFYFMHDFRKAESTARAKKLGLWGNF